MEVIEIEQHKIIVNKCTELLKVCLKKDYDILKNILDNSKNKIDNYNNKNLTIVDVTKQEKSLWSSTIKKVVYGKYYNPIKKYLDNNFNDRSEDTDYICKEHKEIYTYEDGTQEWFYNEKKFCNSCKKEYLKRTKETDDFYKKKDAIKTEFKTACNNTKFSNDLMLKCILLNRKIPNKYKVEGLFLAIKETIHTEILTTFQNQNKKLITKYI